MAKDIRPQQLAELVLNYSVSLKEGDRLLLQFDPAYVEYANIFAYLVRERNAEVRYDAMSIAPNVLRGFIKRNNENEWAEELARRNDLSRWCNSRVLIYTNNPDFMKGLKNADSIYSNFEKKVIGPYKKVLYREGEKDADKFRWNIVGFPNSQNAKEADMSLRAYEDFVYDAALTPDWIEMGKKMTAIKEVFNYAKDVHIYVPGLTDLHFSLENRGGRICEGKRNMPDGEVFYGPVEDSMNGHIYFQPITKVAGKDIQGISLDFKDGKITKFGAKSNLDVLERRLDADEGVKSVGEFGIGCNYGIKKATANTLFDEKIGGTIHLALGSSYKELSLDNGGGNNESKIHWDIVCDLRKNDKNLGEYPGGEIRVDGKLVQKDGVWNF